MEEPGSLLVLGIRFLLHGSQVNLLLQFHHTLFKEAVGIHQVFYCLATVNYRGMISSAKVLADGLE